MSSVSEIKYTRVVASKFVMLSTLEYKSEFVEVSLGFTLTLKVEISASSELMIYFCLAKVLTI